MSFLIARASGLVLDGFHESSLRALMGGVVLLTITLSSYFLFLKSEKLG